MLVPGCVLKQLLNCMRTCDVRLVEKCNNYLVVLDGEDGFSHE